MQALHDLLRIVLFFYTYDLECNILGNFMGECGNTTIAPALVNQPGRVYKEGVYTAHSMECEGR